MLKLGIPTRIMLVGDLDFGKAEMGCKLNTFESNCIT